MSGHSKKFQTMICEQLGEDIDEEICAEIAEHMAKCPDCRMQIDSIKQTVHLYRQEFDQTMALPGDVEERLFKVLSLKRSAS